MWVCVLGISVFYFVGLCAWYQCFLLCRFVCLVSGLEFGGQMEQTLTTQLFVDLLTGQLGDGVLQESMAKVVRVVVAGNSLSANTQDKGTLTKVGIV